MDDWWDLGDWVGYSGNILSHVTCAFCNTEGHLVVDLHAEKKHAQRQKILNYDTCRCSNCGNLTMVLWAESNSGGMANFRALPWPLTVTKHPEHWPADVGRFWLQAKRSIEGKNYDAAALMARSALQIVLRKHEAKGNNLNQEIDDLADKGLLPPIMKEWAHTVRLVGNDAAHPKPDEVGPPPQDVKELVRFLDFLLEYLYDLPHRIQRLRAKPWSGSPQSRYRSRTAVST